MTNAAPTRIRVKSAAPLSEFRIWASIPLGIETIGKLKDHLCENVYFLKGSGLQSSWLMLELEDYELLDASPISLLQDGDVLMIKRRTTPIPSKRKAERQGPSSSQHKKRKLSVTSTSGSSSTSASSETTSSTSADSSSASSLTTDSSTAGSSINPLRRNNTIIQNITGPATTKQFRPAQSLQPVPPGLGKPSTHARNKRRKIKRQRQKNQTETLPEDHDWKQADHAGQTIKEGIVHDNLPLFPTSRNQDEFASKISDKANAPHFIPPSGRVPLPRNIFVTSVDVEDPAYQVYSLRKADTPIIELPSDNLHDWDGIDKKWNTYTKIAALTTLSAGMVVGWRAFGLNPTTLTPEPSLLHLGKIIENISDSIRIAVISRGKASFGGVVVEEEPEEELAKLKESIISEEWRIINHS